MWCSSPVASVGKGRVEGAHVEVVNIPRRLKFKSSRRRRSHVQEVLDLQVTIIIGEPK